MVYDYKQIYFSKKISFLGDILGLKSPFSQVKTQRKTHWFNALDERDSPLLPLSLDNLIVCVVL